MLRWGSTNCQGVATTRQLAVGSLRVFFADVAVTGESASSQ